MSIGSGIYWMSFVDPERPEGDRFLGCLIVRGRNDMDVIRRSHMLGLNPGGEVMFFEIPKQYLDRVPIDWIETRLINREECEAFEKRYAS